MLKNYLKIALRSIQKQKGYVALNIVGLAVGLACFILMLLFVQHELSYDRYHEDTENVYRILQRQQGNEYLGTDRSHRCADPQSQTGARTRHNHRIVKRACARVGLDATLYSGHSLRAGFITQAARAGKPERITARHSGHRDLKTLREYIREGGLFQENAVSGLGL